MRYEIGQVLKKEQVMELVSGNCAAPKNILGRHWLHNGQIIAAFHPKAVRMQIIAEDGSIYDMEKIERQPIFAVFLLRSDAFSYRVKMYMQDGRSEVYYDPYCFSSQIMEREEDEFLQGKWLDACRKLGAHPMEIDGVKGTYFAVKIPRVRSISVIGDFNDWDGRLCPMHCMERSGIFEIFIPGAGEGNWYCYEIKTMQGKILHIPDPCGTSGLLQGNVKSKILNMNKFDWNDEEWMKKRQAFNPFSSPVAIGPFPVQKADDTDEMDLRDVFGNSFTHVLVGGQSDMEEENVLREAAGNYFAPVVYGDRPENLRETIRELHQKGIGILMEISYGSGRYRNFSGMNYLLTNLYFWLKEYHIDGFVFREKTNIFSYPEHISKYIDVSSGRAGDVADNDARDMLYRRVIRNVHENNPGILLIADGRGMDLSRERRRILKNAGIDFIRNYGIKGDLKAYLSSGPQDKSEEHLRLTSHLQKLHGEHSLLCMDVDDFFGNMQNMCQTSIDKKGRVYYDMISEAKLSAVFIMGIPGKKLSMKTFENKDICGFIHRLLSLYHTFPALYVDGGEQVFEWINGMDVESSVLSFLRKSSSDDNHFLFICNFNRNVVENYHIGVPEYGRYMLLADSDSAEFGGENRFLNRDVAAVREACDFQPYSITISLPPKSALIFGFGPAFVIPD